MKTIYIAGPIGDVVGRQSRVAAAIDAARPLLRAGMAPFAPHLWAVAGVAEGIMEYEAWIDFDLEWVRRCDALLRIPGESPGADREVAEAFRLGKPVFLSVAAALAWGAV
jgi:hypothetical protein